MNERERRQRFEREIDEIIEQKGGFLTGPDGEEALTPKPARQPSRISRSLRGLSVSPWRLLMSGIAMILIVALLWNVLPSLHTLLFVVAIGLFLFGYFLSFAWPGGVYGGQKRWRGQVIDDRQSGPSPFSGLSKLFKRKKKQ